ncbi:hypothetical protein M197_gp18 [Haloarcula hispanica tailed virus 2]|uniref:Uncharacterized protein n=1 Tax=Haloarcula hispanica tailed virus 2 TaxID=1273751 RepID=R4TLZ2_9CAUD|nr:hypothetical protein M197_gp18 [Haloarcula hispanica tailed virus 2]AGM11183.1 hypothetical protein HHTV2_18 [Haloarcula hispanica tailed virus 2]
MPNRDLRVNCERCGRFTEYEVEKRRADGSALVRCAECGKRHGEDSIYHVDLERAYRRDESGALVEDLP